MIFKGKHNVGATKMNEILIQCDCGTHLFKISTFDDNDDTYYFEVWGSNFYTKQKESLLKRFLHRLKLIWNAIRGKEYLLEDIVLNDKDYEELIDALSKVRQNKKSL